MKNHARYAAPVWTAILLGALASPAFADDDDLASEAEAKAEDQQSEDLPTRIGGSLSQGGRRGSPFMDFSRMEINPFVGAVLYGGDFDADPDYSLGVLARIPMSPFGGRLGLWAEGLLSHIDRDLEVFQPDHDGNVFVGALGFDFELAHGEHVFLRAQAGGMYASFQNVNGAEDGFGGLVGLSLGWHWIRYNKNISFTYNPQFGFDGGDWMMFHHVGLNIDF